MADDDGIVAGDRQIRLEGTDAEIEGQLEPRQRVLGRQAARAAMALQVEGSSDPEASDPDCAGERCDPQYRGALPEVLKTWW